MFREFFGFAFWLFEKFLIFVGPLMIGAAVIYFFNASVLHGILMALGTYAFFGGLFAFVWLAERGHFYKAGLVVALPCCVGAFVLLSVSSYAVASKGAAALFILIMFGSYILKRRAEAHAKKQRERPPDYW